MRMRTRIEWLGGGFACTLLLAACSATTEPTRLCANPAPLLGELDPRTPGYIVQLRPTVAVRAEVGRLAAKYDFTPTYVYETALKGFSADLSSTALAGVRCEATVTSVDHDALIMGATQSYDSGIR